MPAGPVAQGADRTACLPTASRPSFEPSITSHVSLTSRYRYAERDRWRRPASTRDRTGRWSSDTQLGAQ
jgi:hypothetical protein